MSTIKVTNISKNTSEKEIRDFFSFCGRISSLEVRQEAGEADVTFEKESAAKTALLLDNTVLSGSNVHVTSGSASGSTTTSSAQHDEEDELSQEDKPRSRIFAEYLAHGYKLGDNILNRAIEADSQHGISKKFTKALQDFDTKTGASAKAGDIDQRYGVSGKVQSGVQSAWLGLSSYYEKFTGTPTGQRVHKFYTDTNKQALDIHNEAIRLAGLQKQHGEGHSADAAGKNPPVPVAGTDKTTCGCGGEDAVCGCSAGKCSCSSCPKSSVQEKNATETVAASTNLQPLGEKQ